MWIINALATYNWFKYKGKKYELWLTNKTSFVNSSTTIAEFYYNKLLLWVVSVLGAYSWFEYNGQTYESLNCIGNSTRVKQIWITSRTNSVNSSTIVAEFYYNKLFHTSNVNSETCFISRVHSLCLSSWQFLHNIQFFSCNLKHNIIQFFSIKKRMHFKYQRKINNIMGWR